MSAVPPVKTVRWRIVSPDHAAVLPKAVVTAAPALPGNRVAMEVGLLLPAGRGREALLDAVAADPPLAAGMAVGLFMANPFLAVDRDAARLTEAGIGWVSNLPSTHQQDAEFRQQLADVGLDWTREVACLTRFGERGLRRLAVLCDEAACADVLDARPDAIAILPRVADFAAGFPSMLRRGGAAQTVTATLRGQGWSGPVLVLGSESEASTPTLWPPGVDGLLLRPVAQA